MTLSRLLLAVALIAPEAAASDGGGFAAVPDAADGQTTNAAAAGKAQDFIDAGLQAFRNRRLHAALAEFQKAVDADPQSAAAAFYLGYTYYKLAEPHRRGDPRKAKAAELFARAFELDPGFWPAWGPKPPPGRAEAHGPEARPAAVLTDEAVARLASARVAARQGRLILDNDAAFQSKLDLVTGAKTTVDAMYYIWQDDFSSSVLAGALIDAAKRGVRVRLLVDYHTNYKRLDLFSMMEARARGGAGSLEVRFYNRPTRNVVRDAVYLALGCGTADRRVADASCTPARFAEVERRFDAEQVDGQPARALGISNLDLAGSGLFLSGWYAKRPDVMAAAVVRPPAGLEAASGPDAAADPEAIARAEGRIRLTTALSFLGDVLNPVSRAVAPYRPARLAEAAQAVLDWDHLTDYLHHKLLLVDGSRLQLGGRNVEDSYHMQRNLEGEKYVFMDTDLRLELSAGGDEMRRAFERLWGFRTMVATLPEVRLHAPNDFVANRVAADEACAGESDEPTRAKCVEERLRPPLDRAAREARAFVRLQANAERYRREYKPEPREPQGWELDSGAGLAYVENLPFKEGGSERGAGRSYGARNGQEAAGGKRIHALWLSALADTCRSASASAPKEVLLHNAYFFPPTNLTRALARMTDGSVSCGHVTVTVVTNSIETTDLNVVNVLARHVLKAFAEHAQAHGNAPGAARVRYLEYKKPASSANLSLHSKVSVFGDDFMVGSANTDVRSYMMDSNNAMFVRGAPRLREAYMSRVHEIVSDPARMQDLTDFFAGVTRERMRADDQAFFRGLLARYGAEKYLSETQRGAFEASFLGLLDRVYGLAKAALEGGADADARAEEFNRLFKPI